MVRLERLREAQRIKDELELKVTHLTGRIEVLQDIESSPRPGGKLHLLKKAARTQYHSKEADLRKEATEFAKKMTEESDNRIQKHLRSAEALQQLAKQAEDEKADRFRREKAAFLKRIREHEREKFRKLAEKRLEQTENDSHSRMKRRENPKSDRSLPELNKEKVRLKITARREFLKNWTFSSLLERDNLSPRVRIPNSHFMESVLEAERKDREEQETNRAEFVRRLNNKKRYAELVKSLYAPRGRGRGRDGEEDEEEEEDSEEETGKRKITYEEWLAGKELSAQTSPKAASHRATLSPLPSCPRYDYLPEVRFTRESAQSSVISRLKSQSLRSASPSEEDLKAAMDSILRAEREAEKKEKLLKRVNVLHRDALEIRKELDEEMLAAMKSKLALIKTS